MSLVENIEKIIRTQAAKIEALTQELADAKQAAHYETDVAQQAIADFEEAKGKIEALEKAYQWIPVSERLPGIEDCWCIVYADGAMNCMGYWKSKWQRWACKDDDPLFNINIDDITHWKPLPQPPIAGEAT